MVTLSLLPLFPHTVVSGSLSQVSHLLMTLPSAVPVLTRLALYIPQFQVTEAYTSESELASALGIYLSAWGIVTFIFLIGTS